MITTPTEFDDETAWDRTVIALVAPVMPLIASGADVDLRTRNIAIGLPSIVSGASALEELRNRFLPLVFGAAWKILDLALELALATAGISPRNGRQWTIFEKSQHALANSGNIPGFPSSSMAWQALGPLYAGTRELRHALVHRRVQVNTAPKELVGFDLSGVPLLPLRQEEQLAFCRIAQRVAQAIIAGTLSRRSELDLLGQLAIVQRHHGVAIASKTVARPPVRVIDTFPDNSIIDVAKYMSRGQASFPGAQFVDIELHIADGRVLVGELDVAPQQAVSVDLANLPTWLRFL